MNTEENARILDWHFNSSLRSDLAVQALGYIPTFVFESDPRPAWEQFNERYIGGWNPMLPGKWRLDQNGYLYYPGDPVLEPLATAFLRDEQIYVYQHAFVCIVQRDGSFSVARMD